MSESKTRADLFAALQSIQCTASQALASFLGRSRLGRKLLKRFASRCLARLLVAVDTATLDRRTSIPLASHFD